MRKRRSTGRKTTRRSKKQHPSTSPHGALITRPRRDPLTREWVPLAVSARALGFDWRTLRKYIAGESFVRVLGGRWYVRHAELVTWWERQRPGLAAAAAR